ncbi:sensor histidine kinase [Agromyces aerolatus]|uniref:sensor histidine kinase n=1 Tax=Agromyces sp. LY-1074 TaxID=3074080 RepID=UPI00285BF44B|nr:ATP-binding protein [Agromyces sp. LY-1074]MDR5700350.1 ATP-binding protein [Agromyces sp. LY-1074]MDR5706672.1 ATP-binding protein [Agromyces sp. LY-1358]
MARPTTRRRAVSRAQVETVSARALGIAGLVFSAQTVPAALEQSAALTAGSGIALMAVLYGAAVIVALASFARVGVRGVAAAYAVLYVIALSAWPFLVADPTALGGAQPWLYFLCTVATTAAVVAFPVGGAIAYTIGVPLLYGVVRLTPAGGEVGPALAGLNAVYALILGVVVLVIITMLRQAAEGVDLAQDAALQRYDIAARQHATETERVRIDALVHDSVLTTLLSAAAAETEQEQALAARMAREAVKRLDEAGSSGPRSLDRVPLTALVRRLHTATSTLLSTFDVRVTNVEGVELPVEAVEALYTAAAQAMVNSAQHGDVAGRQVDRQVRIAGISSAACRIEVVDDGAGFDPATVPQERLGLRVSIEERMTNAGGAAHVVSRPGAGTSIVLTWPGPLPTSAPTRPSEAGDDT